MKKTFPLPGSLTSGPVRESLFMEAVKKSGAERITKDNWKQVLKGMNRKYRSKKLRRIYDILRKGEFWNYNSKAIIAEMGKYSGKSKATIERAIYKLTLKKNNDRIKTPKQGGIL